MDKAAVYRIVVRGVLHDNFVDELGGLKIVELTPTTTILEGQLPDQAAVMGTLDVLYNLHLPLIKMICFDDCV